MSDLGPPTSPPTREKGPVGGRARPLPPYLGLSLPTLPRPASLTLAEKRLPPGTRRNRNKHVGSACLGTQSLDLTLACSTGTGLTWGGAGDPGPPDDQVRHSLPIRVGPGRESSRVRPSGKGPMGRVIGRRRTGSRCGLEGGFRDRVIQWSVNCVEERKDRSSDRLRIPTPFWDRGSDERALRLD